MRPRTSASPAFPHLPSVGDQLPRGVHLAGWKHAGRDVLIPKMSSGELVTGTTVTVPSHMTTAECAEWLYELLDAADPAPAEPVKAPLSLMPVVTAIATLAGLA